MPPDFSYTVVKLKLANRLFSFVTVADFDTAPEPTIGIVIVVSADGCCRRMQAPKNPFIYHHKWLFVADNYDGFDVEESKARSRAWMGLPTLTEQELVRRVTGRATLFRGFCSMGLPTPSPNKWILVEEPPRQRPKAWSEGSLGSLFSTSRSTASGSHDGPDDARRRWLGLRDYSVN